MRKDAALLAVLCTVALFLPAAASAGTYDVVSCNTPGGDGGGINRAWTLDLFNRGGKAAPAAAAFKTPASIESCATPLGLTLSSAVGTATVKVDDGAGYSFTAPAGTTVRDATIWRHMVARPTSAAANVPYWMTVARAGTTPGGSIILGGTSGADYCPAVGSPVYPGYCIKGATTYQDPVNRTTYLSIGQPVISWSLECGATVSTAVCATGTATEAHAGMEFQGAKVTVEDLVPPEVGLSSALDGWRRPSDALNATAADVTGIRLVRVLVDGVERAKQSPTCDYHLPAPCPPSVVQPFDLSGVADGRHSIVTIAEDTAGNVTRIERTVDLDGTAPVVSRVPVSGRTISALISDASSGVAGGTIEIRTKRDAPFAGLKTTLKSGKLVATVPKSVKGSYGIRVSAADKAGNLMSAVVTSMSLSTRVGKRARKVQNARATIPYGRSATVLGRLTSTDGAPIGNQTIVLTGVLRQTGATALPAGTATTDANGRFSVTLPPGPSRALTVTYPGIPGVLTRTRAVALRVPASSTIRASKQSISGAGAVRFSGNLRMLGTTLPPGGKLVDLQASQRGRWSTVATTRATGATGAWHAIARFRGTPGRFPVRLRIRREALFPYELGYSASLTVRVR
jgi:hypothetical protein